MHTYYEAKDLLKQELDQIVKKGELSAGSLETIDKLLNSIKNACKIIMAEEYSEDGYSNEGGQGGGMSSRRAYAYRRDSRGRYASEGSYANAREGRGGNRGGGSRRSYAYDGGENEEKVEMLREMMQEVSGEERMALQKIIRRMEQE